MDNHHQPLDNIPKKSPNVNKNSHSIQGQGSRGYSSNNNDSHFVPSGSVQLPTITVDNPKSQKPTYISYSSNKLFRGRSNSNPILPSFKSAFKSLTSSKSKTLKSKLPKIIFQNKTTRNTSRPMPKDSDTYSTYPAPKAKSQRSKSPLEGLPSRRSRRDRSPDIISTLDVPGKHRRLSLHSRNSTSSGASNRSPTSNRSPKSSHSYGSDRSISPDTRSFREERDAEYQYSHSRSNSRNSIGSYNSNSSHSSRGSSTSTGSGRRLSVASMHPLGDSLALELEDHDLSSSYYSDNRSLVATKSASSSDSSLSSLTPLECPYAQFEVVKVGVTKVFPTGISTEILQPPREKYALYIPLDELDKVPPQHPSYIIKKYGEQFYSKILSASRRKSGFHFLGSLRLVDPTNGLDLDPSHEKAKRAVHGPIPQKHKIYDADIVSVKPFGLFCRIPGFRVRPMIPPEHFPHGPLPKPGQKVYIKVMDVSHRIDESEDGPGQVKVDCSMVLVDQTTGKDLDPDHEGLKEYPPLYSILKGFVVSLMPFGTFCSLESFASQGLLHKSQISQRKINHPADILRQGDSLYVKVVAIEKTAKKTRLSLSSKYVDQRSGEDLDPTNQLYQADITFSDERAKRRKSNNC